MTLDEKLSEIGIKRMLVIDDRQDHVAAAKDYFKEYAAVRVDYASSEAVAIVMIQEAYEEQKYDLALSDMQMERTDSGARVSYEAFKRQGLTLIVTGRDESGHHGPSTTMIGPGFEKSVSGMKSQPATWQELAETATAYVTGEGRQLYDALQRYHEHVGKPSEDIADLTSI